MPNYGKYDGMDYKERFKKFKNTIELSIESLVITDMFGKYLSILLINWRVSAVSLIHFLSKL